jgi:hypothetical protein
MKPTTRMPRNTIIAMKPKKPISRRTIAHGKRKRDLEVEQNEENGHQVVAHVELHARILERLEPAFVRRELLGVRAVHAEEAGEAPAQQDRHHAKRDADQDEHEYGEVVL